jgi:hypothetical protein
MKETPPTIAEARANEEEAAVLSALAEERRWRSRSVERVENHPASSFVGWYFDSQTNSSIQIVRHPSEKDRVLAVAAKGWAAQMKYVERKDGKYIKAIEGGGKALEGRWNGGDGTIIFSNNVNWRWLGSSNGFGPWR